MGTITLLSNGTKLTLNRNPDHAICPMHNLSRDGFHRQTIAKGRVNYEPSSIDGPQIRETEPVQGGFASFPEQVSGQKLRNRSETFADHYSQATLFRQSQTPPGQQHIVEALQFELGKLTVPAVKGPDLLATAGVVAPAGPPPPAGVSMSRAGSGAGFPDGSRRPVRSG